MACLTSVSYTHLDSSLARIDAAQKEIDDLNKERELLLADTENEHYERLAVIRTTVMQLTDELNALKAHPPELTRENLARVIELWTKIPASTITEDEFERLSKLGDRLREHIAVSYTHLLSPGAPCQKRERPANKSQVEISDF